MGCSGESEKLTTFPASPALRFTDNRTPMLKVLIADDHAVVRQGLKQIVTEEFGKAVLGEAENAQEALKHIRASNWDIAILDITMPGQSGMDVLKEIKQLRPKLPVLVLSMHPEDQFAVRVLKAGASGYMTKEKAPEELVQAIKEVVQGGRYVSLSLAKKLAFDLATHSDIPPHETLSDREYEVLRMIASGKRVKEIAKTLHLSVKTVSTYRARILDKMQMKSTVELIRYTLKNRLVD